MTPQAVLDHYDQGLLWPADRPLPIAADVDAAYQQALALRALRTARGERAVGYKIGFTNRTIWPRYEVYAPIWGTVWNTTLTRSSGGTGEVSLDKLCQPRLEPEIVFGMAATPPRRRTGPDARRRGHHRHLDRCLAAGARPVLARRVRRALRLARHHAALAVDCVVHSGAIGMQMSHSKARVFSSNALHGGNARHGLFFSLVAPAPAASR